MIASSLSAMRDLGRVHELASILVRYGFGDLVRRLGLAGLLERAGSVLPLTHLKELVELPEPVRVRRALEDMGPTFVKLGQVLATRVDLLGPEWIAELERLQSHAPPVPVEAIRGEIEAALGAPPEALFAAFDPEPLAAASIAQVHAARLADGTPVVVKVRRPGIEAHIQADMRLLARVARFVEEESPGWRRFRPVEVVRQFKDSLGRELDLAAECRNAERIAAAFAGREGLVVPRVYWEWTTTRTNVQARIEGAPVSDLAALDAAGIDRHRLARQGARAMLRMVFEDGFFHADPHAGNVFALPGGDIALIDYGMVGHLSEARRAQVVRLLHGLVQRDSRQAVDVLLDWTHGGDVEEERLAEDVDALVDRYHGLPLKDLDLGAMLGDVTRLLRAHGLALPPDLALLIKVFVTMEGLGRRLDPEFDMVGEAAPFLRRAMLARHAPEALARRGLRAALDTADVLADLPRDLRRLLRAGREGNLRFRIDVERLSRFGDQFAHAVNRLTLGIVIAALIVGSSIALTARGGPTLLGLPAFGLLGFLGAGVAGVWLLVSIWRSGGGR
ncbi:ABC1 kinase family protein [Coralloluteibacterium thermophilus]|uniref:ABC1 kinase family protein n=1 Tax=Coralloluteibacterium thermophilum TaxID=2707049 RepID=A0ABV9NJZ6_9GAMM